MRRGRVIRRPGWARHLLVAWSISVTIGLATATATVAADPSIKLAAEPVGEGGQFFHRSLQPGEAAELVVDLANYGEAAVRARTFAADVYSIINGGFGARLRGEATSGTTTWLAYPTEVLEIEPGQAVRRSFTVTVPDATKPGEYITSIVIENEDPLVSAEGLAFNQFVRTAIAVSIVVPGPTEAAVELGQARHSFLDGRSVVGVAINNVGDLLLRPVGTMGIVTEAGDPIDNRQVAMDSVYAHTATWLEVVLDGPLAPGRYLARVDLADPARGGPVGGERPFVVGEDGSLSPVGPATAPTDTIELPIVGTVPRPDGTVLPFIIGSLIGGLAVALVAIGRRRRRDSRPGV